MARYVIQVRYFIINPKHILALMKLKVIISCIVLSHNNSLFLQLFLSVCLQCNFLLFFTFKTELFAFGIENFKVCRAQSETEMGQWVKHIFLDSLHFWV